jgi:phage FluMu protein Com
MLLLISFPCWHCGKNLKAPDNSAGLKCKCTGCGKPNTIPGRATEEARSHYEQLEALKEATVVDYREEKEPEVLTPDTESTQLVPTSPFSDQPPMSGPLQLIVDRTYSPITQNDSVVIFLFRWFLILAAVLATVGVGLSCASISGQDYWRYAALHNRYKSDAMAELLVSWFVVMMFLGGLYALAEIARALRRRT